MNIAIHYMDPIWYCFTSSTRQLCWLWKHLMGGLWVHMALVDIMGMVNGLIKSEEQIIWDKEEVGK